MISLGIEQVKNYAASLDDEVLNEELFNITLDDAKRIASIAGPMQIDTIKRFISGFYGKYGVDTLALVGYIDFSKAGDKIFEVLKPFSELSFFNEIHKRFGNAFEEGCIEIYYPAMLNEKSKEIKIMQDFMGEYIVGKSQALYR